MTIKELIEILSKYDEKTDIETSAIVGFSGVDKQLEPEEVSFENGKIIIYSGG